MNTDKAENIEFLFYSLFNPLLEFLLSIFLTALIDMTLHTLNPGQLWFLNFFGFFGEAVYILKVKMFIGLIERSCLQFFLQYFAFILLLLFILCFLGWQLFVDRSSEHFLAIPTHEYSWQTNDSTCETTNITDKDHEGVRLQLDNFQVWRQFKLEYCFRHAFTPCTIRIYCGLTSI